jgi:DNA polymerase V
MINSIPLTLFLTMPPKPIPPELLSLRRHNALALFVRWRLQEIAQGRAGSDKAFAKAMGIANAHWSRLKAGTPLGPRLARRLEAACGVEEGWLDQPHEEVADERSVASSVGSDGLALLPAGQDTDALLSVFGPGSALTMPQADHSTPAGFPSPAADFQIHSVDLADQMGLNQPSTFIARVRGLSMVGKGIDDGDLLVINRAIHPKHGQTVVAVIDNELTCKTLYQRNGQVKLQAANPDFPDIVPKEGQTMTIWGVVTAVIKKMAV